MSTTVTPTALEGEGLPDAARQSADTARRASLEPTPEQLRYARLLEKGMRLGLVCLVITFSLYLFGIVAPHVPVEKLDACWLMDRDDYFRETGVHPGWWWVSVLYRGDFLNFIGIVILAGVTGFCYLGMLPLLFRNRDRIYLILAVLQVAILALAASGVLAVGH